MIILDVHGYQHWDLYLYLPVGAWSHADVRSMLNPPSLLVRIGRNTLPLCAYVLYGWPLFVCLPHFYMMNLCVYHVWLEFLVSVLFFSVTICIVTSVTWLWVWAAFWSLISCFFWLSTVSVVHVWCICHWLYVRLDSHLTAALYKSFTYLLHLVYMWS